MCWPASTPLPPAVPPAHPTARDNERLPARPVPPSPPPPPSLYLLLCSPAPQPTNQSAIASHKKAPCSPPAPRPVVPSLSPLDPQAQIRRTYAASSLLILRVSSSAWPPRLRHSRPRGPGAHHTRVCAPHPPAPAFFNPSHALELFYFAAFLPLLPLPRKRSACLRRIAGARVYAPDFPRWRAPPPSFPPPAARHHARDLTWAAAALLCHRRRRDPYHHHAAVAGYLSDTCSLNPPPLLFARPSSNGPAPFFLFGKKDEAFSTRLLPPALLDLRRLLLGGSGGAPRAAPPRQRRASPAYVNS